MGKRNENKNNMICDLETGVCGVADEEEIGDY